MKFKKVIAIAMAVVMLLSTLTVLSTANVQGQGTQPPTVTSPAASAYWSIGETHTITWDPANDAGTTVLVIMGIQGGAQPPFYLTSEPLNVQVPNADGQYTFTIGADWPVGNYRVIVSSLDSTLYGSNDGTVYISEASPSDTIPPTITCPPSTVTTSDQIKNTITDDSSGVDWTTLVVKVDGNVVPGADVMVDQSGGVVSIPAQAAGTHTIEYSVSDLATPPNPATQSCTVTVTSADTTPPNIVSTNPSSSSGAVDISTVQVVTFSEPMDKASTEGAFHMQVSSSKTDVLGTKSWSAGDTVMTFTPSSPLQYKTDYMAWVTTDAKDVAGNSMTAYGAWGFSTVINPTPPTVSVTPADGATGWNTSTAVVATFSQPMDSMTASSYGETAFNVYVNGQTDPLDGTWTWNPDYTVSTFQPKTVLQPGTTYHVVITTDAMNGDGVHMASEWSSTFTTKAAPTDTAKPTITGIAPYPSWVVYTSQSSYSYWFAAGYTDDVGVTSAVVTVDGNDVSSDWGVSMSGFSHLATFTIGDHTIVLTVKDAAGNTATQTWDFNVIQHYAPTVLSISPADGTKDVGTSFAVLVTFSEPMSKPSTEGAFSMHDSSGASVPGTFSWNGDGTVMTFRPSAPLKTSTSYTATEGDGATDWLAGWKMSTPYSSTFTTKAPQDTEAPVISDATCWYDDKNTGKVTHYMLIPDQTTKVYVEDDPSPIHFEASLSDNERLQSWSFYVDGASKSEYNSVNAATLDWVNSEMITVGTHAVKLTVMDSSGNKVTQTWNVDVIQKDMTPPTITNFDPLANQYYYTAASSTTLTISASFSDNIGVTHVTLYVDQKLVDESQYVLTSDQNGYTGLTYSTTVSADPTDQIQHYYDITVSDAANNVAYTNVNFHVVQDLAPPIIYDYVAGQIITDTTVIPTIGASFSDNSGTYVRGSGVDGSKTQVTIDGTNVKSKCTISDSGFTYPTNQLSNGDHAISVTLYDIVGNKATSSWTVHVTVPNALTASFTISPGTTVNAGDTLTFTSTQSGGTSPYTYSWDFGDGSKSTDQNPTHSYATQGTYSVVLTVTDRSGTTATSTQTITVNPDKTPPSITNTAPKKDITIYMSGNTINQVFSASFSDNVGVKSVAVYLDGSKLDPNQYKLTSDRSGYTGFSYKATLGAGTHKVLLNVADAAGNHATYGWKVTVVGDTTPPSISNPTPALTTTLWTSGLTVTQKFTATLSDNVAVDPNSVQVSLDGSSVDQSLFTHTKTTFAYKPTLSVGDHTMTVTVKDTAGNSASLTWTIKVLSDTTAPTITGQMPAGGINVHQLPWFTIAYSDGQSGIDTSSVKVVIDGTDVTKYATISANGLTFPKTMPSTLPTSGTTHDIKVVVKDNVGNKATATWRVTVR